jgi:Tfp pilus assembly protein PilO
MDFTAKDIIELLLGLLIVIGGYWLNRLSKDVEKLEDRMNQCQNQMPYSYVLKEDYKSDVDELKQLIRDQGEKTDKLIGKLFQRLDEARRND